MTKPLPSYATPPLVEVVFGCQFEPVSQLTAAHSGLLWTCLDRERFPVVTEQNPLPPFFENLSNDAPQLHELAVNFPRLWFASPDNDSLVQFQRDRFLVNWRAGALPYPRFATLHPRFEGLLAVFEKFSLDEFGIAPEMRQFELTYVNHIPWDQDWSGLADALHRLFPDIGWRDEARFLSAPEAGDLRFSFRLPTDAGRLHVRVRDGRRKADGLRVFNLELTCRGFAPDRGAWFELAHDWIVRGFADFTSQSVQEHTWQREPQ